MQQLELPSVLEAADDLANLLQLAINTQYAAECLQGHAERHQASQLKDISIRSIQFKLKPHR